MQQHQSKLNTTHLQHDDIPVVAPTMKFQCRSSLVGRNQGAAAGQLICIKRSNKQTSTYPRTISFNLKSSPVSGEFFEVQHKAGISCVLFISNLASPEWDLCRTQCKGEPGEHKKVHPLQHIYKCEETAVKSLYRPPYINCVAGGFATVSSINHGMFPRKNVPGKNRSFPYKRPLER